MERGSIPPTLFLFLILVMDRCFTEYRVERYPSKRTQRGVAGYSERRDTLIALQYTFDNNLERQQIIILPTV